MFRDLLIINGVPQNDSDGFSGDSDSFDEPLADANTIEIGPSFKVSTVPSAVTLAPNDSSQVTIKVSAIAGFTDTVTLDATTSANDITISLSNGMIILDSDVTSATSDLTVTLGEAASGAFTITVNASSSDGITSRSVIIPVNVQAASGGCLIATAAYGTELAPQVQFLREIRDNQLMSTSTGAAFMTGFNQFYYSFSPYIADMERENPMFQEAVRAFITPMVSTLSIMTLSDDGNDVQVLGLGLSVIALNIGMYIAGPAFIGIKLANRRNR